jgi:hypothetical protein
MSFFSTLLARSTADPIEAIGTVLDKVLTSDEERLQVQFALEKLRQHPAELQAALNKLEAKHRSLFVAGWRPFIGWISGLGLANLFLINPWLQWLLDISGPALPMDNLMELVIALLGLGTLRTVEKIGGKTK